MANITIKTNSPGMALGLTEGAATVELRKIKAEYSKLQARDGVRAEGDEKRWPEIQADMARTYSVKRHGRVYESLLLAWAMLWLEIVEWYRYFEAWNRGERI